MEMQANDYANALQHHSLFSNREERKGARFKKNPSGERVYGKQKYSSQKGSSVSSSGNATALGQANGHQPHSMLEQEIRQIMNQS